MFKKLCILLIFSKLKVTKLLIDKYRMHNLYAIFARIIGKISALTILQYINYKNEKPIGRVKYALF